VVLSAFELVAHDLVHSPSGPPPRSILLKPFEAEPGTSMRTLIAKVER